MADIEIESVAFLPEGMVINYFNPEDARVQGRVILTHQASISRKHPDYAEDIDALQTRALRALKNCLEDWGNSEPFVPEDDENLDDERGMGE